MLALQNGCLLILKTISKPQETTGRLWKTMEDCRWHPGDIWERNYKGKRKRKMKEVTKEDEGSHPQPHHFPLLSCTSIFWRSSSRHLGKRRSSAVGPDLQFSRWCAISFVIECHDLNKMVGLQKHPNKQQIWNNHFVTKKHLMGKELNNLHWYLLISYLFLSIINPCHPLSWHCAVKKTTKWLVWIIYHHIPLA